MFESKLAEETHAKDQMVAQEQPVQDFLQVWAAMMAETKDCIRLGRLELKVDATWARLTQAHKDAVWMIIFPEHRAIRDVFHGHAESIR